MAEEYLWEQLKGEKLYGFKFRRQHIIDLYIADFVCLEKNLVIEIDGNIHQLPENKISDQERTRVLNDLGFSVVRFSNEAVLYNIVNVLGSIDKLLRASYPQGQYPTALKNTSDTKSESIPQGEYPTAFSNTSDTKSEAIPPLMGGAGGGSTKSEAPLTRVTDYLGAFAVTAGIGIEAHVARLEAAHDDYAAILLKALADRLAEAFAERLHERVRKEFWGYAQDEHLDNENLIHEAYQGIRPAPGYPACPEHSEKRTLWQLLDPDKNAGIQLTEHFAMYPTAAVSGWYFSHPEARYFGLGQIGRDQVEDYARRKGMSFSEAERWLAPVLNYD